MQQDGNFEQMAEDNGVSEQQSEEQQMTTEDGQGNDQEFVDDDNEDDRKLFVGGISWDSTVKDVREYFEKYGKVINCTLKTDFQTQKSRGFGFVCFAAPESVDKVLAEKEHKLNGRNMDPKKATPRPKKIFVGKLDPDTPQEEVSEYFSKFGEVEKMEFPFDKMKEKRRAFCFVEFKKMSAFKKCLEETSHKIKTQEVDVKKATIPQQPGGNMRGGPRGRGFSGPGARGGRGGFQQYGGYNQNYYQGYYDPNAYYDQSYYNDPSYYGNNYYQGWNGSGYNAGYGYGSYGNQTNFGKTQKRGGGQGFHPYNR